VNRARSAVLILVIFVISRLTYLYFFNISFDATSLNYFWQIVDPDLLKHRLFESIYYLHGQPPLFNLFLGLVLKAFPIGYRAAYHLIYLLIGVCYSLSMFLLLERMRTGRYVALALTVMMTIAPATVVYENWLFYSYPVAAGLCLAALLLHRYVSSGSFIDGLALFSLLAVTVLMRFIFSIFWYVAFAVVVFVVDKPRRRRTLKIALAPLVVLLLFTVKQLVVFGQVGAGSVYIAPNLAHRIRREMPLELQQRYLAEGRITPLFLAQDFPPISEYEEFLGTESKTGIPLLDMERKSTGRINTHNILYIVRGELVMKEVRNVMLHNPALYLKSFLWVMRSPNGYFVPSWHHSIILKNKSRRFLKLARVFDILYCGQFRSNGIGWFLLVGLTVVLTHGLWLLLRSARKPLADKTFAVTLLFAIVNIVWLTVISVSVSYDDYNRYRFEIDAFYVLLLGLFVTSVVRGIRSRFKAQESVRGPV
jgi:hypothetical protein